MTIKGLLFFLLALTVGAAVFFGFSLVYRALGHLSEAEIEKRLTALKSQEVQLLESKKVFEDWKDLEQAYSEFKKRFLIKQADISNLRSTLEALLAGNQLKPTHFQYQTRQVSQDIQKISVRFSMKSHYAAIKKWLYDIENTTQMIFVNQLRLTADGEQVSALANLEAYFAE